MIPMRDLERELAEALNECAQLRQALGELRSALARERGGGTPLSRSEYIELHRNSGELLDRREALAGPSEPDTPDPGSFGGHPYTPDERALGYGTANDPRFQPADSIRPFIGRFDSLPADSQECECGRPLNGYRGPKCRACAGEWYAD